MVVLTEKFRFIRDDVFLCPWVDTKTGKQKLVMRKINLSTNRVEFEDSIDCIHTAVTDISTALFSKLQSDNETQEKLLKKTLYIRSSENLREIKLTPEEKFKALKSWVAGIAEFGMSALKVQFEIEKSANLSYPIGNRLFRFMTKADSKFIYRYLSKIEKECKFEGVNHKSSLIANLQPIIQIILDNREILKTEKQKIMSAIIDIDPPCELFEYNPRLIGFLKNFHGYFNNFRLKIFQKYSDIIGRLLNTNQKSKSMEKIEEFLKILWTCFVNNYEFSQEDKKFISVIMDLEYYNDIIWGMDDNFEWMLNFIMEDNLNILDALNSYYYDYISTDNPSFTKKLINEAKKKCTKGGTLNSDCFEQYYNKIAEYIYEKYEDIYEFHNYNLDYNVTVIMNEQEKEIVFTSLSKKISSSLLEQYPKFLRALISELFYNFEDTDKTKNSILSILLLENPNYFEHIKKREF